MKIIYCRCALKQLKTWRYKWAISVLSMKRLDRQSLLECFGFDGKLFHWWDSTFIALERWPMHDFLASPPASVTRRQHRHRHSKIIRLFHIRRTWHRLPRTTVAPSVHIRETCRQLPYPRAIAYVCVRMSITGAFRSITHNCGALATRNEYTTWLAYRSTEGLSSFTNQQYNSRLARNVYTTISIRQYNIHYMRMDLFLYRWCRRCLVACRTIDSYARCTVSKHLATLVSERSLRTLLSAVVVG